MESCSCADCQSACRRDPGRFLPGELTRLATFLELSLEELYRQFLVVKPLESRGRRIWVPAPGKRRGPRFVTQPGHKTRSHHDGTHGTCVFLTEAGFCSIHPVKPYECGAYMGCKHSFQGRPYKGNTVENFFFSKWKGFQSELPNLPIA